MYECMYVCMCVYNCFHLLAVFFALHHSVVLSFAYIVVCLLYVCMYGKIGMVCMYYGKISVAESIKICIYVCIVFMHVLQYMYVGNTCLKEKVRLGRQTYLEMLLRLYNSIFN